MARKLRPGVTINTTTVACGATNQDNKIDLVVPSPNATLLQASFTTKTAGGTTGTCSVQVTYGSATAIGAASATTFIDADSAAGTLHGIHPINILVTGHEGERLGITTVKAGTFSSDATLIVQLTWQL